ncbi:DNA excision repair protein ERCC-8-like [Argiope bruennichi]|uniref:DNA excision repair protein ERCC-8 like protein n=1 Tax=Argiope bruennichi TaxID=94029 RepID=A0A8T0FG94_ARGBR|nr:DNA excision repair protein ERCC-8-like [Argiope bruennichi]XP_055930574.1 DNA excision repair protein ERCC-8-like [Argiope bruennichi]XP_055930575.1 DNA excision repair protein ERCC-8-like [Argiope bruennichi]XP_055930576.1 DNA excision repair protein ERCC-8-like [Argiope bruennichi]XP_055930577.1 DNA excision repair protein ERCC-8-like [Argiope bruennichi]XP_055930578.1 DNA excision repair protein ERCC-8-like [Argiope bruennichi]XP_055930580.1 DNA excision repair protein ERCC-8-like [Arg
MLRSLEMLQAGLLAPKSFQSAVITNRLFDMDLSERSIIRSCHNAGITTLDIDRAEERYLLSGAKNGDIAIHDLLNTSGHPSYAAEVVCRIRRDSLYAHKFCIKTAQWYPFDTGLFITSAMDQKLKIWDTNILKPADTISVEHNISGHHMSSVSSKHSLIAVAMKYPHIKLIDPKTGSHSHELRGHQTGVASVRWSPISENLLASGGVDNKIFFWDIRSAKGYLRILDQHNGEAIGNKKDFITAHDGHVNSLRFTDDGLFLVSHGADNRIRLWDVALCKNTLVNFGVIPSANAHFQVSIDMCCDSSLPVLFVPSKNCIIVHDLFTGCKLKILSGHLGVVTSCVYRSRTQELYSSGNDMNILLWTPDVERELEEEYPHSPCHGGGVSNSEVSDNWSSDEN